MEICVVCVEQSLLPGQTTPSMTAEVRAGPGMERTTPNASRHLTPGNYAHLVKQIMGLFLLLFFQRTSSLHEVTLTTTHVCPLYICV